MKLRCCLPVLALLCLPATADDWNRFRGANGSGVSQQPGIPTEWDDDAPAWQKELPGVGHSSPCIHGKRLFVTSATDEGTRRLLLCLDADSGQELWRRELTFQASHRHRKNSWASGTPACDGRHVYATFADEQSYVVRAWNLQGEQAWTADLGAFDSRHGVGASPVVADGLVLVANEQLGPSCVAAFDAETGKLQWKTPRPSGHTSYVTPVIADVDGRPVLICASTAGGVSCLNLQNGEIVWETDALPHRAIASPVLAEGLVMATCGSRGQGRYLLAVDLNSPAEDPRIIFERRQRLPYVPTPVVWNNLGILWGDGGVISCIELPSGTNLWTDRVPGDFSSSPICVNGHVYCTTEDGVVTVIRADREFELVARNPLGDSCHASPAVANEHLYLRTFHRLIALKAN